MDGIMELAGDLLRQSGTPYGDLGLHPDLPCDAILDAMIAHPILINRPIVATALGLRLCRPSERVLDILRQPQRAPFIKEDGTTVTMPRLARTCPAVWLLKCWAA